MARDKRLGAERPRTREALAMFTRCAVAAMAALILATAAAATSPPRFKLRPGWTKARALANTEMLTNRTNGFSFARCWVSDGNAKIGWRHDSCVGNTSNGGTGRFKVVYTPVSCTKERVVITIAGLPTQRRIGILSMNSAFRIAC
jgi:hypothetical protein